MSHESPPGSPAVRTDEALRITEEAEFFGSGPDRLFGLRYLPASVAARTGIVICSPVLAQFNNHYRTGTLLARLLASRGTPVQRFHYRGMGNSDGDVRSMSLASMVDDAGEAADRLGDTAGVENVVFMGVSLGCYAAAAASKTSAPVMLDSPPPTGRQFFRKAFRSHGVAVMREQAGEAPSADALLTALQTTDDVSLLGFRLSRSLYDDFADRDLLTEIGVVPRPVLLIEGGRSGGLSTPAEQLQNDLVGRDFEVETLVTMKEDPFWYVENAAPEDHPETETVASKIVAWLASIVSSPGIRP